MEYASSTVEALRELPVSIQVALALAVLTITYSLAFRKEQPYDGFPVARLENDSRTFWQRLWQPAYIPWLLNAKGVMAQGQAETSGCFQVLTASGYKVVVPNRFAEELKNLPHLSFNEALIKDLMVDYPGFDGHRESLKSDTFIQEVTRIKLTQSLGLVTDDLVDEARDSIRDIFGEDTEWHTRLMKNDLLDLVSRLSSRVFLGKELCRNDELMQLFKEHTNDTSVAMSQLQMCPALVRPLVYWFIPSCTRLRKQVKQITEMILPEVEKRRHLYTTAVEEGDKRPKFVDSIAWMVEIAKGRPVNYVAGQLALSFAAIHMTTDALCKCLMQLCKSPECIPRLRKEMLQILREDGWERTSLYKFKYMDSFMKEVLRTNPVAPINMVRMVKRRTMLSDGTVLLAGTRIMVLDNKISDPATFPAPDEFHGDRFLALREQPGAENRHQFVTVTSDQLSFGLGTHACPGRFFAANEMKIALCFLLLKFDFRHVPGGEVPKMLEIDMFRMCEPGLEIQMRRRTGSEEDEAVL